MSKNTNTALAIALAAVGAGTTIGRKANTISAAKAAEILKAQKVVEQRLGEASFPELCAEFQNGSRRRPEIYSEGLFLRLRARLLKKEGFKATNTVWIHTSNLGRGGLEEFLETKGEICVSPLKPGDAVFGSRAVTIVGRGEILGLTDTDSWSVQGPFGRRFPTQWGSEAASYWYSEGWAVPARSEILGIAINDPEWIDMGEVEATAYRRCIPILYRHSLGHEGVAERMEEAPKSHFLAFPSGSQAGAALAHARPDWEIPEHPSDWKAFRIPLEWEEAFGELWEDHPWILLHQEEILEEFRYYLRSYAAG